MRTWPPEGTVQREQVYVEFGLTSDTIKTFEGHPVENFERFFAHGIPLLLIAGDSDEIVPFELNAKKMMEYCHSHGITIKTYIKPGCAHHPHSLEDVAPIVKFVN